MLPPHIPLEIHSQIYTAVGEVELMKHFPDIFWAIAPEYLQTICVSHYLGGNPEGKLQNNIIRLHPSCGNFIEMLTIITNHNYHLTMLIQRLQDGSGFVLKYQRIL